MRQQFFFDAGTLLRYTSNLGTARQSVQQHLKVNILRPCLGGQGYEPLRGAAVRFPKKRISRHLPIHMGGAAQEPLRRPSYPIGQIIVFCIGYGEAAPALLCLQPVQTVGDDLMPCGAAPRDVKGDGIAAKIFGVHLRAGSGNAADDLVLRQWKVGSIL